MSEQLQVINNCPVDQDVFIDESSPMFPFPATIPAGGTSVFNLPGSFIGSVAFPSPAIETVAVSLGAPGPDLGTVTLYPIDGKCVIGTGPDPMRIVNNCSGAVVLSLLEFNSTGQFVSIHVLGIQPGETGLMSVFPDTELQIFGFPTMFTIAAGDPRRSFLTLASDGQACVIGFTPSEVGVSIVNSCSRDAMVTINEIGNGMVLTSSIVLISAGTTYTYFPSSVGTPQVQVCLRGRCVTVVVGTGPQLVTLAGPSGFCAPQLGVPRVCPVVCARR